MTAKFKINVIKKETVNCGLKITISNFDIYVKLDSVLVLTDCDLHELTMYLNRTLIFKGCLTGVRGERIYHFVSIFGEVFITEQHMKSLTFFM